MTKTTTLVEGHTVKVGDYVGFKCDIEQVGRITSIRADRYRGDILTLVNPNGFEGEYIGGETETEQEARDCWRIGR